MNVLFVSGDNETSTDPADSTAVGGQPTDSTTVPDTPPVADDLSVDSSAADLIEQSAGTATPVPAPRNIKTSTLGKQSIKNSSPRKAEGGGADYIFFINI